VRVLSTSPDAASPKAPILRPRGALALLGALGAATVASYLYADRASVEQLSSLKDVVLAQALLFLCAAGIVSRVRLGRPALALIVFVGLLCRVPLVLGPPKFSDDIYRYVWDGRVQAAGVNPYRYVPADPALARLRDAAIYPHINRRDYAPTIYPPVAQMLFLAFTRAGETVTAMKAGLLVCEAVTVGMLAMLLGRLGLPRTRVLLYAWNPLVIWQYAVDGHIDAAAIAFVAMALVAHAWRRDALAGAALGCATLVKWYPAVLFPALYRRGGWKMPAALAAVSLGAYLPYLGAGTLVLGFLPGYAREEGVLSGHRFFLLGLVRAAGAAVPTSVYIAAGLATLFVVACRAWSRPERTAAGDIQDGAALAAMLMVLISTHYLWYFGWLALFLAAVPSVPLLYLTGAATYLFAALGPRSFGTGGPSMFDAALYVPSAALGLAARLRGLNGFVHRRGLVRYNAGCRTEIERVRLAETEM
jgi:alpha-1,6-mannosyltransferase